jgi:peptidoglycan/xylan/chitin deacetylase (PgdA/CDA1 family)/glycosyltransferase involved in cell wall biosynthesis
VTFSNHVVDFEGMARSEEQRHAGGRLRARSRTRGVAKHALTRAHVLRWRLRGCPAHTGLRILCWHRIADADDQLAVTPARFAEQLDLIERSGQRVVDLRDLDHLELAPGESVLALTFDDGYRDLLDHAIPMLEARGWPATVFVATEVVEGHLRFPWYAENEHPELLGWDAMREVERRGPVRFESHTLTHADLQGLGEDEVWREIEGSRRIVTEQLGRPSVAFCYPGGFFGAREAEMVERAGYSSAVTCESGVNAEPWHRYRMRRITVDRYDTADVFEARLRGGTDEALLWREPRETASPVGGVAAIPRDRGGAALTYAAVIPTKDRPQRAAATVECLLQQERLPSQVVVVDSSAPPITLPDTLVDAAASAGVELRLEHHRPSTSAQRNRGAELVDTPVVLFLDDDAELPTEYMATIVSRWERAGLNTLGGAVGAGQVGRQHGRAETLLRRLFMLHVVDGEAASTTVRRSGKVSYVPHPDHEVVVQHAGAGAVTYRRDLVLKHRFDERFSGYALGEDYDMARRVSRDAPILQVPSVEYVHHHAPAPDGRQSPLIWYYRGRRESFFRLRHLDRSPVAYGAFGLSVAAETAQAALASLRTKSVAPVRGYVCGLYETLRDSR